MCQAKDRFIFCSCEDKNEDSTTDELTVYYTWYLVRFLRSEESNVRGKIMMPKKDLGHGITLDAIQKQLNSDFNSFDFDYEPSHRDCLQVKITHPVERFRYFKLIFIDGKWKEGANNVFTSITKKIGSGNIKRHINSSQGDQWVIHTKDSVAAIFKKLDEEVNRGKNWNLITELVKRKPKVSFIKAKTLVESENKNQREIGIQLFVGLYNSDYEIDTIFNLLLGHIKTEKEEKIISLILSTISYQNELFTKEQIVFLSTFKTYRDDVKYSLMDAFGELKNDTVIDVFIEFSKDKNPEIRETAIYDLEGFWEADPVKISKALWEVIEDENKRVRHYAILGLSKHKDEKIKMSILKELEIITPKDWLLLDAIENLNDKSFIPHIEFQIEKHKNTSDYLTKLLKETLAKLNAIE